MKTVPLGEVTKFVRGVTYKPSQVIAPDSPGAVGVMRTKNVQRELDLSDVVYVPKELAGRPDQLVQPGDILISSANSWNLVGKCCWVPKLEQPYAIGGFITGLRATSAEVDPRFLYQWAASPRVQTELRNTANQTTNIANLNLRRCAELPFPLPPLDEQRRIVAILDQADQVRHRVRSERDAVIALKVPIFSEMFGKYEPDAALGDLADVQGGLQVSGKRATLPVELPYLRVANVYRDRLDLLEIKTIRATQAEADRTRLVIGDLLFVEGHGNPDEVGRAAVWDGSIPNCVHQNHLIRARLNHTKLLPEFAAAWFNSPSGASYFKRAGKTTSGLNTISASEVRSAPIPVPPLDEQREFTRRCEQITHISASCDRSTLLADELVSATQSRAFAGRL